MNRRDRMQVIAVANRKGGTGKTSSAVNLAAEMAARGLRTVLIDLDTQGHAGISVGLRTALGAPSIHDLFRGDEPPLPAPPAPTGLDNLWLAPADREFDGEVTPSHYPRLARTLEHTDWADGFERVVVDTPPSLGGLLMSALHAADAALIPFVPHHLSAEGVRQLAGLFFRVASEPDRRLSGLALLPTLIDPRIRMHREVLDDMARQFGEWRLLRGIRTDIRVAEASRAGRPVRLYAPRSRGAMDYWMLYEELERLWGAPVDASAAQQKEGTTS